MGANTVHEQTPADSEPRERRMARELAESFTGCCFDEDGHPTEQGLKLINKLREVQFYLIGGATDVERRQQQYPPPGVVTGHHVYGECCVVAADSDPAKQGELLIVRRDTAVADVASPEHWMIARYQLNTGDIESVPVYEGRVTGDADGADVSLLVPSRTNKAYEPDIAHLRFHATDGDYADTGASIEIGQYYGRTTRTIDDYSVDFAVLREELANQLIQVNPRAFGILTQPGRVTAEQFMAAEATTVEHYEQAA